MLRMFFPDKGLIAPTGLASLLERFKEFFHCHMQKDIL